MGYPLAYRRPRPSNPSPAPRPRRPGVGGNNVIPFPGPRRPLPRGTFGPPGALPGRANFGQWRPTPLPVPSPARPFQFPRIPARRLFWALGLGLTAWDYWDAYNNGQLGPLIDPGLYGFNHICGPNGWPGPPYLPQIKRVFTNSPLTTPVCGTGLQATGTSPPTSDIYPVPNTRRVVDYWVHDTLLNRGFVNEQWSRPTAMQAIPNRYNIPIQPYRLMPTANARLGGWNPLLNIVDVVPTPVALSSSFNGEPPFPEGPERGYAIPTGPNNFRGNQLNGFTDPYTGVRLRVSVASNPRDQRPEDREKERKNEAGSRLGRMAISGFRGLQTWGSINGAIDALWRAIPRSSRPAGKRSWWQKYQDVYEHFDEIDLATAALNSTLFAAQQRFYASLFNSSRYLQRAGADVNAAFGIQRGLGRVMDGSPAPRGSRPPSPLRGVKEAHGGAFRGYSYLDALGRLRWRPARDTRRQRTFSGRETPTRRRQQARLRSRSRKLRAFRRN